MTVELAILPHVTLTSYLAPSLSRPSG